MYVAAKVLRVQTASGKLELREIGDPVPEAVGWKQIPRWVGEGYIKAAENLDAVKIKPKPTPKLDTECSDCGRVFASVAGLNRHRGAMHKKKKG